MVRTMNDSGAELNTLPTSAAVPEDDATEHDALIDELQALIFLMGRLMTFRYAEGAGPDGLSLPQYMLLRTVEQHGPVRVSDIASALGVKTPAVSMLLQAVEERGLVTRDHAPDDRRAILVSLTESGRTATKHAERLRRELTKRYTASLTLDELRSLVRIQSKLAEAASADDTCKEGRT